MKTGIPDGLDLSPDQIARVLLALCGERASGINGKVVHTAAGYVREYVLRRVDDSELVNELVRALGHPEVRTG